MLLAIYKPKILMCCFKFHMSEYKFMDFSYNKDGNVLRQHVTELL